jgi:hypothetical protein
VNFVGVMRMLGCAFLQAMQSVGALGGGGDGGNGGDDGDGTVVTAAEFLRLCDQAVIVAAEVKVCAFVPRTRTFLYGRVFDSCVLETGRPRSLTLTLSCAAWFLVLALNRCGCRPCGLRWNWIKRAR